MDIDGLLHSSFKPSVLFVKYVDIGVLEGVTFLLKMQMYGWVLIRWISRVVPWVCGEAVWSHLCRGKGIPLFCIFFVKSKLHNKQVNKNREILNTNRLSFGFV